MARALARAMAVSLVGVVGGYQRDYFGRGRGGGRRGAALESCDDELPCDDGSWGRVCTARSQRRHSAHMTGRNWGFLLQLAIFLPIQTILHPHNVGQPDVSPHHRHKRCQCTQPQQRHIQKKARIMFVLNSKCECRTPLCLAYIQDMHHSTWRPHPQPHGHTAILLASRWDFCAAG